MLHSFKSFELVRYYVSKAIEDNTRNYIKENEQSSEQLASTIFSTTFSLIATFVASLYENELPVLKNIFVMLVIFLCGFFVAYTLFLCFLSICKKIRKHYKKYRFNDTGYKVKLVIDEFDHIVCDNILICNDFIEHYNSLVKSDIDMATFDYHEITYYLKTSINKVVTIVSSEDIYINTPNCTNKIDIYRLINLHKMMQNVYSFLIKNFHVIKIDDRFKNQLQFEINEISLNLSLIKTKIDNFIKKNYP